MDWQSLVNIKLKKASALSARALERNTPLHTHAPHAQRQGYPLRKTLDIPATIAARSARLDFVPNTHSSALPAGLPAPFRDLVVLALVLLLDAF